ncbi:ADP-ribosylglycohydrolase family protein [Enterobacter hormaechei]|nr:ADP-ribosylglycohydrolase family protein [Enterobacter hormaechei]EGQ5302178.1 ADP-ribosylglycohydrolase family protein [Enterobacter hormaechei]
MDTAEAHAFEVWDKSLPLVISETNSLDKAVGALVGLAVGDAVGAALECKRRDSEYSLNLGTLASKAFSTTDEELAKHLSNANYIASQMAQGLKIILPHEQDSEFLNRKISLIKNCAYL